MLIEDLRVRVVNLLDRDPFFYNLIGGNLVGGAIGLFISLIEHTQQLGIWTLLISTLDMLVAGLFMSRLARQMDIIYERIEIRAAMEEGFDFDKLLEVKRQLLDENSYDIIIDSLISILLLIAVIVLLTTKSQLG